MYSAGGIIVSAHTQYTSVSGNPCWDDSGDNAPHTPHRTTVVRAKTSQGRRRGAMAAAMTDMSGMRRQRCGLQQQEALERHPQRRVARTYFAQIGLIEQVAHTVAAAAQAA